MSAQNKSEVGSMASGTETISPFRDVRQQFFKSPVAVAALCVLLTIVIIAITAPLISPQDPYDLRVIDIKDGRLKPGSPKLSKLATLSLKVSLSGLKESGVPKASVTPTDRSSDTSPDAATIVLEPHADSSYHWTVRVTPTPNGNLDPLKTVNLERLPRGSTLSVGKKDKFRNIWRVSPDDARELILILPKTSADVGQFRVAMTGGPQKKLMTYWLGTDDQGRDMLSGIFYGLRISLSVALSSVVIALTIGTILGLCAAYYGGRTDTLIMRLVDLQLSFPTILIALILLAILGKGVFNVMLALVIVQWALYARTARGVALTERRKEYVESAQCLGLSAPRVILAHILPNCLPSLIVIATLEVAGAISLEATLSFLGLGLPITKPSLGLLIANGFDYLLSGYPWISILPGIALLITVFAINLVGDRLRDILNPRLRR